MRIIIILFVLSHHRRYIVHKEEEYSCSVTGKQSYIFLYKQFTTSNTTAQIIVNYFVKYEIEIVKIIY